MTNDPPPAAAPGDPLLLPLGPDRSGETGPAGRPTDLQALPDESPRVGADGGLQAVTGGGLVAVLDPTRGLRSLWKGPGQIAGALRLRWGDRSLHPARALRLGPGGWSRRIPLPDGGFLLEVGSLPDSAPAAVIQWSHAPLDGTGREELTVELQPPGGRRHVAVSLPPPTVGGEGPPATIAILEPGAKPGGMLRRIHPLHARQRHRTGRLTAGRHHGGTSILTWHPGEDPPRDRLAPALRLLRESPTGMEADGAPRGPFLLGIREQRPVFAGSVHLAELGLGALQVGFPEVGWAAMQELASGPPEACPAVLHLAGELVAWSGDPPRLATFRGYLDGVLEAVVEGDRDLPPSPAAFPGMARILQRLADGTERLGGGWREEVLVRRERLLERRGASSPGRKGPTRSLPVLGAPNDGDPDPALDRPATLPPPHAFGPLDSPGMTGHRVLQAARLSRAWIEGALGASPDGGFGRLELEPDFRTLPPRVEVKGLLVGGAAVDLDCRVEKDSGRFVVVQRGGRTPLNVVFRPMVPLPHPVTVHLGGREIDVTATPVEGGCSLELQFPLDPDREILVKAEGR